MGLQLNYVMAEQSRSAQVANDMIDWSRDYFARRVNSRWIDERRCIPPHILMDFAGIGLFGFNIEEQYGGAGLRARDWGRVLAQFAALDSTVGYVPVINALTTRTYTTFASQQLKDELLPQFAAGRILAGYAQTEHCAGSNFTAIQSKAVPDPATGGWRISGDKTWIGNGGWSAVLTAFAQTDDGLTAFRVPTNSAGVTIGKELNTMGLRGVVQNEIHFRGVAVNSADVVGTVGGGTRVGMDAMAFTRLTIAAHQIGNMKRCVQLMHRFALRRSVSTGTLIDNAVALNFISECISMTLAAEDFLFKNLDRLDSGETVPMETSALCKLVASEFLFVVADKALQLLGGRGYEENNIVGQIVRDARVTRIFEGPTEVLAEFVGRRLSSGRGRQNLLDAYGDVTAAPKLADSLGTLREKIDSQAAVGGLNDIQASQLFNYRAGILASWALLATAYKSSPRHLPATQHWLEQMLAGGTGGPNGPVNCILPRADIDAIVAQFAEDIGDVEQTQPALNWSLDEMLRV